MDSAGALAWSAYEGNGGSPLQLAVAWYEILRRALPPGAWIARSCATGYGEALVSAALRMDMGEVETIAHYTAAASFLPGVDAILDIGGQDMKFLRVRDGVISSVLLNEACSSGCDAISRLETMCLMAGIDFPIKVIREQIAGAIDLIVQQARLRDGSRKIVQITEVQGMEGDIVVMQDIFRFIERGMTDDGQVIGEMQAAGIRPKFTPRLEAAGLHLPPEIFASSAHRK